MRKPSVDELNLMKKTVDAVYLLSDEDWAGFSGAWHKITLKKNQTITVAGNVERYLYFILEGVQRIFFLDEKDREATLLFTYAPSFGGVIDSMFLQQPSRYYFETLSASVLLAMPFDKLCDLIKGSAAINSFIARSLTISLSGLLERMTELQVFSSEEKFQKLLQRSPHILQLVPQKYLANYIGIDPTNFSKLMNRLRI
ncbi:MAG TPA: Crp/Fnr family transcriptional regulator [Chitinophagaceae bacterium]|jgi:CRP-like cAMP-binding protein|nr:Crp/Fnr family transcriptional regulator [Chitinophagaceae bacterium]